MHWNFCCKLHGVHGHFVKYMYVIESLHVAAPSFKNFMAPTPLLCVIMDMPGLASTGTCTMCMAFLISCITMAREFDVWLQSTLTVL